jgi:CheY-like chemotaxis protein
MSLVEAENGAIGVEKFKIGEYDLVLMDLRMPVMDGLQATRLIREWERHHDCSATPIIPVTADALSEHREQLLALGCDAYLSKPVSREALIPVVQANSQRRT